MPITAPKHGIDTTNDACSFDNGPDSNGAKSDVKNKKFGPAHAHAEP